MSSKVTLPLTFTSYVVPALGEPVVAQQKTISSLGADEVLVRVAYSSLNPMDPMLQKSNFFQMPLPIALGYDFSGTVVAAGSGVTGSDGAVVGAEVFGFSNSGGCFAEYVVLKRDLVHRRGAIPLKEAAAYGVAYSSAYEPLMVVDDLTKRKGQTIYIAGGGGGVGHFAVQIAKTHGLTVIASASKEASLQLLRSLHADHVIDYSKQDVVQEVLKLTGGKGADVVYDPTYNPKSFLQSVSVVAKGGRWMRLGAIGSSGDDGAAIKKVAESRGAEATYGDFGRYWANPEFKPKLSLFATALEGAPALYQQGKVRPHISATVEHLDAKTLQQAIDDTASQKANVGKVVVKIAH